MSEHRRKPPQPQGGGRAAARRGQSGSSSGRRAAPRGATGSPSGSYGADPYRQGGEERPYGGRAEARRAAQRSGGRRRAAEPGRRGGPPAGRGRGATAPGRKRLIDYPRADKYGWRRWVPSWKLVTGLFVGFVGSLIAVAGVGYAWVDIPKPQNTALAQNNVFLWSDGTQMAATGGQTNRQIVSDAQIPKDIKNAVVAAENASFYRDKGVDPMGIARAVVNMARGGETQGGSTITQQYVKNTFLSQEQTLSRKFKELFISIKVNQKLSKDDILAGYLNTAYFGRNAYGIQAAAQAYFGVDAQNLSTEQCVFLAAVLKGPNFYNPDGGVGSAATPEANTKRAKERWSWILDRMVEVDRMTPEKRAKITTFPKLKVKQSPLTGQTGYLVDIAKEYAAKKLGLTADELDRGGYTIKTTFDRKKVQELEAAVKKTQKSFLDLKKRPEQDKYVQFGAASVDPKTGAIVAIYGGDGYDKGHYTNNANTTGVPVGSTWKPIVLASAMQYGTYQTGGEPLSPMARYNGNDLVVIKNQQGDPIMGNDGKPFRQKNEDPTAWGMVTLKKAMERSINTPFAQLGIDVGLSKTRKTAESLGILEESFDKGNLNNVSFSLGTSTPSAIRMADAYATFANEGEHFEPYSVIDVKKNGVLLDGFEKPKGSQALEANIANNITDVLENVVQHGTGTRVKDIGFPVAGKTGTTDKNKSAWFVGYTRELSTAVTLFRTDPAKGELLSMNGVGGVPSIHGGDIPAQIWKDYMSEAEKSFGEPEPFPEAEPIGKIINPSPSPTPTPSTTETEEEEETPSPDPTPSRTQPEPEPTSSDTCKPWDFRCKNGSTDGGNDSGGTDDGGTDGGVTTSPTPTSSDGTNRGSTNGNGNGSGGFFGGSTG
ncbi:transglycosylase domain-containing protein [Streptomyces thermocoprophilus]|jgi:membrane peptidoglycan carboxypeptidase|uniref:Transglycosylase domain-containing protein n=1 Tax=Streptomyces thermocoprophilus TaxID=78356 RepID=A0ABV5VGB8_9ACTN